MDAKELRIGNLVYEGKDIVEISGILKNGFYFGQHGYAANILDWFQPIPLTEEWLLKFGFVKEKLEGYDVHFIYRHQKLHSGIAALYNSDFSMKLDDVARGIKYVHQLQNLYFALIGQELTPDE